jgi:hypothetical protein
MRQISSRQPEERIRSQINDAANASYLLAQHSDIQTPRAMHTTAPKDFTAQVMARIATPPSPPDPRIERAHKLRARAGMVARIYATLILAAAVGIALVALVAPWALVTLVVSAIGFTLFLLAGVAFIARATGGFVSGFGVIYAAMLAALTPSMLMLWGRFRRRRIRSDLSDQ